MHVDVLHRTITLVLGILLSITCVMFVFSLDVSAQESTKKQSDSFLKNRLSYLDKRYMMIVDGARIEAILEHIKSQHYSRLLENLTNRDQFDKAVNLIINDLATIEQIKTRYRQYDRKDGSFAYHLHLLSPEHAAGIQSGLEEASRYVKYGDSDKAKETLLKDNPFGLFTGKWYSKPVFALAFCPSCNDFGQYTGAYKRHDVCFRFFLGKDVNIGSSKSCGNYGTMTSICGDEYYRPNLMPKDIVTRLCSYVYTTDCLFIARTDSNQSANEYYKKLLENLQANDIDENIDILGTRFKKITFRLKDKSTMHYGLIQIFDNVVFLAYHDHLWEDGLVRKILDWNDGKDRHTYLDREIAIR